jgi:hypothetical protein
MPWSSVRNGRPRTHRVEAAIKESLLKANGWIGSVTSVIENGQRVYIVSCARNGEVIIGKGATQIDAWKSACKQTQSR